MVLQLKDKYLLIYILVFIKFAELIFIMDGKCEAAGVCWGDWILGQWCMVLVGQFWVVRDLVLWMVDWVVDVEIMDGFDHDQNQSGEQHI